MNYVEAFLNSGGYLLLGVLFDIGCVIAYLKHLRKRRDQVKPIQNDSEESEKKAA